MPGRPSSVPHLFLADGRNLFGPTGRTVFSGRLGRSALGRAFRGCLVGWGLFWGISVLAWAEEPAFPPHPLASAFAAEQTNQQAASPSKAERPKDSAPVWVRLRSGRELAGHLDLRTSGEELWLRVGSETLNIVRPIGWDQVEQIRLDGQPVPAVFFQRLLKVLLEGAISASDSAAPPNGGTALKLSETEIHLLPPSLREFIQGVQAADGKPRRKISGRIVLEGKEDQALDTSTGPATSRTWLNHVSPTQTGLDGNDQASLAGRRAAYLGLDAWLGQWDADVEADGLVVEITPCDAAGRPTPVHGMLEVTLVIPPKGAAAAVDQKSHRQRWVQQVRVEDFSAAGSAQYRFAFSSAQNNPEWNLDLAGYGAVTAQLSVPGQGVFSATAGCVRVRPFSPVRDQLQQSTGRRFFPWEYTQP